MDKNELRRWYLGDLLSVAEIAKNRKVSQNKVNCWLKKYKIQKRSISEAVYLKSNPNGDPFNYNKPKRSQDWLLMGLGIGLFWGEGNKRSKGSVRLGNTDPKLIKAYIMFLDRIYGVNKSKLKFGLQIFSDISPEIAKRFWINELCVKRSQFQKVIITPSRGVGSYRHKSQNGVLTVYFNNTKLKKIFDGLIENFP